MAGVKAAVDLANSGQKVIILQANDYLGGRLYSKDINLQGGGSLKFDEGASWIHGNSNEHPITQLANDVEGLVTAVTDDNLLIVKDLSSVDVSAATDTQSAAYRTISRTF